MRVDATLARWRGQAIEIAGFPARAGKKILGHLRDHLGDSFTPHEIHEVLDHSSGAIANAQDSLVKHGDAELATERKPVSQGRVFCSLPKRRRPQFPRCAVSARRRNDHRVGVTDGVPPRCWSGDAGKW